jgi:CRISPR/Cas system-associated endonuclease Cas1
MSRILPRGLLWDRAYKNIVSRARSLKDHPPRTFASLLGIEGSIAADYFRVWSCLSIKWKRSKTFDSMRPGSLS